LPETRELLRTAPAYSLVVPKSSRARLAAVETELDRVGLLLQHDAELPSVTALLAGAPIAGSWWGHPLGKQLYEWLSEFERGAGAVSLKLVNGKVTYVAARLWPALVVVIGAGAAERAKGLSTRAKALHERVVTLGSARGDDFAGAGCSSLKEFTAAAKELEAAHLLHVDSVHTASGAHTKVLTPWPAWAKARGIKAQISLRVAGEALSAAADCLAKSAKRPLKIPLLAAPATLARQS
jgi:hypothetical protein